MAKEQKKPRTVLIRYEEQYEKQQRPQSMWTRIEGYTGTDEEAVPAAQAHIKEIEERKTSRSKRTCTLLEVFIKIHP